MRIRKPFTEAEKAEIWDRSSTLPAERVTSPILNSTSGSKPHDCKAYRAGLTSVRHQLAPGTVSTRPLQDRGIRTVMMAVPLRRRGLAAQDARQTGGRRL